MAITFEKAFENSANDAVFYLKHKSFFSYLGAHRYGSTGLPWGHLRMTEMNMKIILMSYFQKDQINEKFYYEGLSYPRNTIGNMIKIASSKGWKLGSIEYERSKHIESFQKFYSQTNYIYEEIKENFDVSIEELLSGLITLHLQKKWYFFFKTLNNKEIITKEKIDLVLKIHKDRGPDESQILFFKIG